MCCQSGIDVAVLQRLSFGIKRTCSTTHARLHAVGAVHVLSTSPLQYTANSNENRKYDGWLGFF